MGNNDDYYRPGHLTDITEKEVTFENVYIAKQTNVITDNATPLKVQVGPKDKLWIGGTWNTIERYVGHDKYNKRFLIRFEKNSRGKSLSGYKQKWFYYGKERATGLRGDIADNKTLLMLETSECWRLASPLLEARVFTKDGNRGCSRRKIV